jgi:hypothetical protein
VELLRPVSADKRGLVEARVLPRAPRQTVAQLRECAERAIARIDADAVVRRLAAAIRDRAVVLTPGEDGMAVLTAVLPLPVARAIHEALRGATQACAADAEGNADPRTTDQRMADCFADLLLRPDAEGRPPVQVQLTVVAGAATLTGTGPGAEEPGEIEGETVLAALVRELAHTLGLLPRPVGEQADSTQVADVAPTGGAAPTEGAALAELLDLRTLRGTALAERPRIAVVDQLSGSLLALIDSIELRRSARDGTGLAPPAETDGYRPSDPLDRFVRLRDRRCRFPGCRARIRACDLDHRVPYPRGRTRHDNLEGLCEHHHRLSHQAPGWSLSSDSAGGLVWTLPGGTTITTLPPRFGTDDGDAPDSNCVAARASRDDARPEDDGGNLDARTGDRDDRSDWRRLTADQRRERIRALVRGRPGSPGGTSAPF